jgi:hypothetical protein
MACKHVQLSLLRSSRVASIYREGALLRKALQFGMVDRRVSTHGVCGPRARGHSRSSFVVLLGYAAKLCCLFQWDISIPPNNRLERSRVACYSAFGLAPAGPT